MKNKSLQIQAVLYQNSPESLMRSMKSIQNAIQVCRRYDDSLFSEVRLCYGDASPTALYDEEALEHIKKQFHDDFSFSYRFFGFNSGSAKGHNILAEKCEADYILLMNPDIVFCPHFLVEIMHPFNDLDNVGIVEGRQTPLEHSKDYDKETGETSWSSGACTLIQTNIFHQVDGYDAKSFFMYCDDVDLSWRVRMLGKRIIYQPRAIAFHAKRLSNKGYWQPTNAESYYWMEATLLMLHKWSNKKRLKAFLKTLSNHKDDNAKKAVQSFAAKKANNELPKPIKKAYKATTFVDSDFAPRRFEIHSTES